MPLMQQLKFGLILIVAAVGGAGLYYGSLQLELSKYAKPEPQHLSLAELAADGYGDNAHVVVSDFFFGWNHVITYGRRGLVEAIYVPAVPLYGDYHERAMALIDAAGDGPVDVDALAPPQQIDVIVKLTDAHDADDVNEVGMLDDLPGVVINEIEELSSDQQEVLREVYPGLDFSECLILEYDRPASTAMQATLFMVGGAIVLLIGALLGFFAWRKYQAEQALAADDE